MSTQIPHPMDEEMMDRREEIMDIEPQLMNIQESNCGTCEGPNAKYVKLISSDGVEFIIERKFVLQSATIRAMLSGPGEFGENETNEIHLEILSHVLNEIGKYLMYRWRYSDITVTERPEFIIDPKMALELLTAANFLEI